MLAYQSASAGVFVCPAVKVSAWALANGALAKANARTSLFNILDLLCVHSTRRDDPRTRSDQPFDKARFKPRHLRSRAPNALLFPWAVRSKWRGVGVGRSNHLFRAARRRERSWNHGISKQPSVKVIDFILKDACRPSFDGPSFRPAIGRRPAGTPTPPQRRDQLSQEQIDAL